MKASLLERGWTQYAALFIGCGLYAVGLNWFIVPLGLYSGGMVGVVQLLSLGLTRLFPILGQRLNLYGLLYLLSNVPILLLAWRQMGRKFFCKTVCGILGLSLFLAVVPVPQAPVLDDKLASVLVGGLVSGGGIDLALTARGSFGGLEVVGVWLSKAVPGFSVGKLTVLVNAVLFAVFLLLFDVPTVLYSMLYMAVYAKIMDQTHFQNINVRLMIFTKKNGVDQDIMRKTARGVTEWRGVGAYTGEASNILVTVINKYEIDSFMHIIYTVDPNAFVIRDDGVAVSGNFERRV